MKRRTFDVIASSVGILLAIVFVVAGGLLTWAHYFVKNEVYTELSAQQITFPAADSPAISAPEYAPMKKYAGQLMTTGDQAEVYADYFIANHLKEIGGGKTYSQLSTQAQADPSNTKLAAQVDTMFKGEMLRGSLLNAYAFGKMATIAGIAAIAAYVATVIMAALGALGFRHARRTPTTAELLAESARGGAGARDQ